MADYTIINASGAELTDVNAGGDDVADGTIVTGITLDGTELAALLLEDGVAVMQDAASSAEQAAVGALLVDTEGDATDVYTASSSTGLFAEESLNAIDIVAALAAGKAVASTDLTQAERDAAARILSGGTQSGKRTS